MIFCCAIMPALKEGDFDYIHRVAYGSDKIVKFDSESEKMLSKLEQ